MRLIRALVTVAGLLGLWQLVVTLAAPPPFILPAPWIVARALVERADLLAWHAMVTLGEILAGLAIGTLLGGASALVLASFGAARRWLLPLLVVTQALPVFALAPLLVLWFGYGAASKIAMAVLIIFFPVTAAFYDGLGRTPSGWLELARSMDAARGAVLWQVRLPAALPAFASGLRVAASVAPIGAVIGEWVGASAGLGYLMLHANGRMQTDLMFAALLVLCTIALLLWFTVDRLLRRLVPWQPTSFHQA